MTSGTRPTFAGNGMFSRARDAVVILDDEAVIEVIVDLVVER